MCNRINATHLERFVVRKEFPHIQILWKDADAECIQPACNTLIQPFAWIIIPHAADQADTFFPYSQACRSIKKTASRRVESWQARRRQYVFTRQLTKNQKFRIHCYSNYTGDTKKIRRVGGSYSTNGLTDTACCCIC